MGSSTLNKLHKADSPFNEPELSEEDLSQVLNSPKYYLISNLANHIGHYLKKGTNQSLIEQIKTIAKQDAELYKNICSELEIPAKVSVNYFPLSGKTISHFCDEFQFIEYEISGKTKTALSSLIEDEDFSFPVSLYLKKGSFFIYEEELTESIFSRACKNSKKVIATMACGMFQ